MKSEGFVATIGMFDGVHRGHQFVLRQVVKEALERGLQSLAITFDMPVTDGCRPSASMLTPLHEKRQLLSRCGIDRIEVLTLDDALKQLTARQFMQQVLQEQYGVQVLLIGYDNRFGHRRVEGFDDYVRYGRELGIEVFQLPAEGEVSSSLIRQQLMEGQVEMAACCLGYPYAIEGYVTHGEHIGTSLGFPTANLVPVCDHQLLPAPGAYAVQVRLDNDPELYHGMMNIGHRPTFNGRQTTLEVHIFHLNDNLYDRQLRVTFIGRLRKERRFDTIDALKTQLQQDAAEAERILSQISSTEKD